MKEDAEGNKLSPLQFLEAIQSGQDPRRLSRIYEMVRDIQDFNDGPPDEEEWFELLKVVEESYKFKPVSLDQSVSAAKTLAEYRHKKMKADELGSKAANDDAEFSYLKEPLTEAELVEFYEVFGEEF